MKKITFLITIGLSLAGMFTASAQGNARVQVIHNSADVSINTVDVYILGQLLYDNAPFRSSTAFQDVPAGFPITIQVAPGNSTSVADSFYSVTITLEAGKTYVAVAAGTRTDEGYNPYKPFNVSINSDARETALNAGDTDILLYQGSTDLPAVNAIEPGVGTIVNNVPYGVFLPYLSREAQDYNISLVNAAYNEVIGNYVAPFETLNLAGQAVTILGSGFFNPAENSNGQDFGLWMSLPAGGQLIELQDPTASLKNIAVNAISVYPNPANSTLNLNITGGFTSLSNVIYDMTGRKVMSGNGITLDVSSLSNDVYILNSNVDGKIYQQRVIVKNN